MQIRRAAGVIGERRAAAILSLLMTYATINVDVTYLPLRPQRSRTRYMGREALSLLSLSSVVPFHSLSLSLLLPLSSPFSLSLSRVAR